MSVFGKEGRLSAMARGVTSSPRRLFHFVRGLFKKQKTREQKAQALLDTTKREDMRLVPVVVLADLLMAYRMVEAASPLMRSRMKQNMRSRKKKAIGKQLSIDRFERDKSGAESEAGRGVG